ncbi:MAG: hypothetical protein HQM00_13870 [Magnetococcales bacterium]|nr:hypothetical protein [Magnetococcales bacterium]
MNVSSGKRIWCAVSGHGFGHWSQIVPVLKALLVEDPELTIHVTGGIPTRLIANTLHHPFTHDPAQRDVGLIQPNPLRVDLEGTMEALRRLHHDWPARIHQECQTMHAWKADLILGNIPYLPMEAGTHGGIPTVALTSLSWDEVLLAYAPPEHPEIAAWVATMRAAYGQTRLALRITPAMPLHPFGNTLDIPPITTLGINRRDQLRHDLNIDPRDPRSVVLVTLGGIPADNLPLAALNADRDYLWLVDHPLQADTASHLHPLEKLSHWLFTDISASVDAVLSKPGYGMTISTVANRIPFLYVRRGTFPDEPPITEWAARYGRAAEITPQAFQDGSFTASLATLLQQNAPPAPEVNGAEVAARLLRERFL